MEEVVSMEMDDADIDENQEWNVSLQCNYNIGLDEILMIFEKMLFSEYYVKHMLKDLNAHSDDLDHMRHFQSVFPMFLEALQSPERKDDWTDVAMKIWDQLPCRSYLSLETCYFLDRWLEDATFMSCLHIENPNRILQYANFHVDSELHNWAHGLRIWRWGH